MNSIKNLPLEALLWVGALLLLFLFQPEAGNHITICPLSLSGFEHCPGCGLGRAISLAMHGEWAASFQYHVLGIPALALLLFRIYQLFTSHIKEYGKGNRNTSRA